MNISKLIAELNIEATVDEHEITGINIDTRNISKSNLFVALSGHEDNGHNYLKEAEKKGASAVLIEENYYDQAINEIDLPILHTDDTRKILPELLLQFYGNPSEELDLIGVTGTNGKTTTTHLIESILSVSEQSTGLIGTIERRFEGESHKGDCTTPSIVDIYKLLRDWSNRGATAVVMEVSSHALDQGRVDGLSFSAAAFTNLSQDHLNYHGTMEKYYNSKKKLFQKSRKNLVYSDGDYGKRLAKEVDSKTVGKTGDYQVKDPSIELDGINFNMSTPDSNLIELNSPLTGLFNYKNISLAAALCLELGISIENVKKGIKVCNSVPGRCERIEGPPSIIVDYAHTPAAMENVLTSLNPLVEGNMICIFGAGGDRDRSKRPKMGRIGSEHSDYAIVTSDNPRTEDPKRIINDILEGINGNTDYHVEVDRGQAIRDGISRAGSDDIVLIVGRGHETEQIIGDRVIPFEDRSVAEEVLETQ